MLKPTLVMTAGANSPEHPRYSDSELKRTLGNAAGLGFKKRYRFRGESKFHREWTLQEIRLLGTATDREVARLVNRDHRAVSTYRLKHEIPPFNPQMPAWTEEEIRLVGIMPDAALAKKLGRTFKAVQAQRQAKNLRDPG